MGISLDELLLDNSSAIKIQDSAGDELAIAADGSIAVTFGAGAEIIITDGTDQLQINADGSVNAVVSATDLDIRNLLFASDSVDVSGSSVTVSGTDIDIRDLAFATDSVDVSGSSVTVSGTDIDIRDLAFATDKVDVSGSSVTVSATDLDIRNLVFATDKADVSGSSVLADTSKNIAMKNSVATVTTTAAQVLAAPLANRKEVTIQNEGSADVYIGSANTVTAANGVKISKNASATFEIGAAVAIWMIAASGSQSVRFLELS